MDLVTIAAVLGHSDLTMAARYTHPTDRGVRKAVEALSGWQQKNIWCIVEEPFPLQHCSAHKMKMLWSGCILTPAIAPSVLRRLNGGY
jgi:hypothetical protein